MRISLAAALIAMLWVTCAGEAALGQAPAFAKAQGLSAEQAEAAVKKSRQAAAEAEAAWQAAAYQAAYQAQSQYADPAMQPPMQQPVQQALLLASPEQMAAGNVQPVGYPQHYPANCPPGGYGWGGHQGYGYASHPGHLFNGGHYGYFGGAHRTPGYPHHHLHREYVGPQGPPTAQVAYPYYTIRGPRDFLMDNPPSIGR